MSELKIHSYILLGRDVNPSNKYHVDDNSAFKTL